MNEIFFVFFGIIILFICLLILKNIVKWKFCVICLSVSTTWIILLILYWLEYFIDPVIIAILMGQSVVGIYYLLEKRLPERFHIFRLPFLLTATFFAYLALGFEKEVLSVVILLMILWIGLFLVYWYRNNRRFKKIFDSVVACCKDW